MDENAEYCAIVAFTKDNDPTCEKNRQQLYALWTAYCIHHQRCNAAILSEQENLRNSPDEYVRELRKDEALLNRLVAAAWHAVPFASVHLLDRIMRRNAQKA